MVQTGGMKPIKRLLGNIEGLAAGGKVRSWGAVAESADQVRVRFSGGSVLLFWSLPGQVQAGTGRTLGFAVVSPVAGQSGPQLQTHLSVWVLSSGWELTAQREEK